jgi:hypothetical protein
MHEIPPMRHITRNTSLDVHHTILPPTATFKPDVELLWSDCQELPGHRWARRLADRDMVLHSAVHLFHDGDLAGGLRDLVDLDSLITQFSEDDGFWLALLDRATELDLIRPCYYALKYCHQILATAVPGWVLARAEVLGAPHPILELGMDLLVGSALEPSREAIDALGPRFGRWLLYVRSHYLRMPLYLLVPHLARKAVKPYS